MAAVCRNGLQFSKTDDTVCGNSYFDRTSRFRGTRPRVHRRSPPPGHLFHPRRPRYHAGVTTSPTPREQAASHAAALVAYLRTVPGSPVVTQLIDLGEHLERAVRAFHMEAIRFRAYTMSRLIKQHAAALPADVPGRMEAILHDLEAAGFQTRSVSA